MGWLRSKLKIGKKVDKDLSDLKINISKIQFKTQINRLKSIIKEIVTYTRVDFWCVIYISVEI